MSDIAERLRDFADTVQRDLDRDLTRAEEQVVAEAIAEIERLRKLVTQLRERVDG